MEFFITVGEERTHFCPKRHADSVVVAVMYFAIVAIITAIMLF